MSIETSAPVWPLDCKTYISRPHSQSGLKCVASMLLLLAVGPAVFGPAVYGATVGELSKTRCYQGNLENKRIEWATSGAWSQSGDSLLLVDTLQAQVLKISLDGEVTTGLATSLVSAASGPDQPLRRPSQIRPIAGGYLLEDEIPDAIFRLDSDLRFDGADGVRRQPMGGGKELQVIYDWTPLGDGILAFGDLANPEGSEDRARDRDWQSAFVYYSPRDSRAHEVFFRIDVNAPVRQHYIGNMPYLAALGNAGYILSLDERPTIYEVRSGVEGIRELPYFPEEFRHRPRLEHPVARAGYRRATMSYKILEQSSIAAGLYAWDDHLYLLAKGSADRFGHTAWWLLRLDPRDGSEQSRVRLPTQASNLTVVPGDFWAFLEKGPVEGIGDRYAPYMETASIVFLPSDWLRTPPSREVLETDCVPLVSTPSRQSTAVAAHLAP